MNAPFDVPYTKTVPLGSGDAEINITRFGDGQVRFSYERAGVRISVPLTVSDLQQLRAAAEDIVLADHLAGFRS